MWFLQWQVAQVPRRPFEVELVGEGGQNVVGVSVNVGCEVLKEMLDAQLNLLAPFLPCQLLS